MDVQKILIDDIIRDYAIQIDHKIQLCILLMFTGYFLYSLIIPRAIIGFKEIEFFDKTQDLRLIKKFILKGFDFLGSLSETFALCSGGALLGIAYIQKIIPKSYFIWIIILLFILSIITISEIIGYIRGKK